MAEPLRWSPQREKLTAVRQERRPNGKWHLIGFDDTACGLWISSTGWVHRPLTSLKDDDVCKPCLRQQGLIPTIREERRRGRA